MAYRQSLTVHSPPGVRLFLIRAPTGARQMVARDHGVQAAADAVAAGVVRDAPLPDDSRTRDLATALNDPVTGLWKSFSSPPPPAKDGLFVAPMDPLLRIVVADDERSQALGKHLDPQGWEAGAASMDCDDTSPDGLAAFVADFVRSRARGSTRVAMVVVARVDAIKAVLQAVSCPLGQGACFIGPMEGSTIMLEATVPNQATGDLTIYSILFGLGLWPPFPHIGGWSSAPEPTPAPAPHATRTLWASFDVEADGDSPGLSSMRALGIHASTGRPGDVTHVFRAVIEPRADRAPGERCMREFWLVDPATGEQARPEGMDDATWEDRVAAWNHINTDTETPAAAMARLADWIKARNDEGFKVQWVAHPAAFDWQWIKAYYDEFGPEDKPWIGYSATCLSTMMGTRYKRLRMAKEDVGRERKRMRQFADRHYGRMTHNPVDDAAHQFGLFTQVAAAEGIPLQ